MTTNSLCIPIIASFSSEPTGSIDSIDSEVSLTSIRELKQKRPPRGLSKEKRRQLFLLCPFSEIKDHNTLLRFLSQNPNVYNNKVLALL